MAYQVGSAFVPVRPDFRNFHKAIAAQFKTVQAEAVKWGAGAGKRFTEGFRTGLGDPLAAPARKAPEDGAKAGGAFARAFKTRLEAAFRSLPEAKINADSSAADRKVAELRARMKALSGKTVGVDISAKQALAEMKVIQAELDRLARKGATIDVRADAAKALAELKAVKAEADAVGRTKTKLSLSADLGKLSLFNKLLFSTAGTLKVIQPLGAAAGGVLLGVAGAGVALGAAAAGAGAFAAVAVPMFKNVTDAQKAYTKARQQYDRATTKAQRVKALKAEQAALASLTPAEKQLAIQLDKLKVSWSGVSKAQQSVTTAALVPWFSTAERAMKFLPDLVRPAASAIRFLGQSADNEFKDPVWGKFFTSLGSVGKSALTGFGQAAINVFTGFANLFPKFAPWLEEIGPAVAGWSASFLTWAQNYKTSGFQHFLDYLKANEPALKRVWDNLIAALPKVADAFKSMPSLTLNGLANVFGIIAKMSPGQIQALAYAYTAAKLGGTLNVSSTRRGGKTGTTNLGLPAAGATAAIAGLSQVKTQGGGNLVKPTTSDLGIGGAWWQDLFGGKRSPGWLTGDLIDNKVSNKIRSQITKLFSKDIPNWIAAPGQVATSAMAKAGSRIGSGLVSGWNGSKRWITSAFGKGYSWATSQFGKAGSWLSGKGSAIGHGLGTGWNATGGWLVKQFGKGGSWVLSQFKRAGGWLSGSGTAIGHGLGTAWNATGGWLVKQFGKAGPWVLSQFKRAGGWLSGAGTNIGHGLGTAWDSTGGWLVKQFAKGGPWVLSQFKRAGGWLTGAGTSIGHGLGTAWNATGGWVVRQFAKGGPWVLSQFKRAGGWLSGAGVSIGHGLGNAWNSTAGWLGKQLGRGKGWIQGPFKGAGSWLKQTGKDVISGLWSGMTFIWNKVTGWIKSLAGWIKKHKGPVPLDMKLLAPNGRALMSGLERGLKQGFGPIGRFVKSAAGKIGSIFSDATSWFSDLFSGGISAAGVANSSAYAALKSAAAKKGWTGAQWNALNYVEMREAGYNIRARNPSSGAYGMAQGISGPSWYAQYGGNWKTAAGQAVSMVNYIAQRYGTPMAAAAHERAYNWYEKGSWSVPQTGPAVVHQGEMIVPAKIAALVRGADTQAQAQYNAYITQASQTDIERAFYTMQVRDAQRLRIGRRS